jgi:hypothetical protein
LFAVKPKIHQLATEQFASYAYRANAAQYFNLVWPVCLGFWSSLTGKSRHRPIRGGLLFAVVLMAACPLIAGSRGPAIVCLAILSLGLPLLMRVKPAWQRHKQRFVEISNQRARVRSFQIGLFFASVLLLGLGLGWHTLRPRLDLMSFDLAQRERLYDSGRKIAHDYSLFGTGPETFENVSQLYRNSPDDYWPAQLHNDWLETRITFGWIGSALILSALAIVLAKSISLNSQLPQRRFLFWVWLALGGCLFQARWDFPLQIYSIVFLFLTWCAASLAVVGMPHALDKATSKT